jgi:PAS domain S-box-containing protein
MNSPQRERITARWSSLGLRHQLIVAFVAVILVPTAIISVYSLSRSRELLIQMARDEGLRSAGARAAAASRQLSEIGADLQVIVQAPALRRYLNAAPGADRASVAREVERYFAGLLKRWAERYSRLCLLDSSGHEVSCALLGDGGPSVLPPGELADRSAEPYFAGALQLRAIPGQESIYISELTLEAPSRQGPAAPVLRYATALQSDSGLLDGVVVLHALVAPVLGTLEQSAAGAASTYVVDRQGHYLLHPDPTRRFEHLRGGGVSLRSERPRDAAVILDQSSGTLYASVDRPDALQVFTRIRPPGQSSVLWTLIDEQSLDAILVQVRRTRNVIVSVAAVALLLATVIALRLTRGIVRPIGALAKAADAIRQGDLDTPLPAATQPDEVGVLTRAFAQMAARVRELVGTLQQRVADLERSDAALRSGQARLRQMIDSNLAGIVFFDLEGHAIEANDAYLRIVGYDREDLREGRIHRELLTPPEYQEVTARAMAEVRALGACTPYEKEFVRKDGSRVPVLIGVAMAEPGSNQAVAFVLDRTASKQAEIERDARAAAELASRAKSEFLTRMSHELRTPLNGILGFAQILQGDEILTQRQARGLSVIAESGQHLLTLINDILDLARIDAAKLELSPTEIDLPAFLQVVCDMIRVKAEEKGLLFVYQAASDLPATICIDEKRLRQVLLNLMSNAVKFTDAGQVTLRVTQLQPLPTPSSAAGLARLRFEVEDEGIGMTKAQLARLFQPFEQVAEMERREGGTGLGLAISRQLIRLMNGDIQVRSQLDAGSVFSFEIEVPATQAQIHAVPECSAPIGYEGERRKVLVIDDVPQSRAMLLDALGTLGFEMAHACDGEEALAVAARFRPDLVVMDMMMTVTDRFEATRRLRRAPETAKVPVIVGSAGTTAPVQARSPEAGANASSRPVAQPALLDAIAALLNLTWIREESAVLPDKALQHLANQQYPAGARPARRVSPATPIDAGSTAIDLASRQPAHATRSEAGSLGRAASLKGARILLVEDNPINREVALNVLSRAGIVVSVACDGQEALDALDGQRFDGVLMDCQMPVLDGYATVRALRRQPHLRDLPVIAMTANAMVGDRDKVLAAGMNDHIAKPIKIDELFATLARWVRPATADSPGVENAGAGADPLAELPGIDTHDAEN